MQEYAGGDGLIVYWKRPSQSTYSLQTDEIGVSTTTTITTTSSYVISILYNNNEKYIINRWYRWYR
jgi:predicted acetyltransferase